LRARTRIMVTAVAGLTLLASPFAESANAASYESKIRLKYNEQGAFSGVVTSDSEKCIANRSVKIVRKAEGDNDVLTRTVTGEDGSFAVFADKDTKGEFYAVVAESSAGADDCDRDRSNTVTA
jgi:hypothetical protein